MGYAARFSWKHVHIIEKAEDSSVPLGHVTTASPLESTMDHFRGWQLSQPMVQRHTITGNTQSMLHHKHCWKQVHNCIPLSQHGVAAAGPW